MERIKASIEGMWSHETLDAVRDFIEETFDAVVSFSQNHKYIVGGAGAVIVLYWYMTKTHRFFRKLGIPGPKPGLFGSLLDYRKGLIEHDKNLMKKYGQVCGIFHGRAPVYMISDIEMMRKIFVKEFPTFVNRSKNVIPVDPVLGDSLVSAFDDHWKFLRNILSPTFTSGKMREMSPLIHRCVEQLVNNLWTVSEEGTKSMKIKEVYGMFTLDVIASTAFGVELDCQSDPDNLFIKYAKKVMKPTPKAWAVVILSLCFPFLVKVFERFGISNVDGPTVQFFVRTINEAIEQRKKDNQPRTDFLQLMLNSHKMEMDKDEEDPDTHVEFDKSKKRGMTNNEMVANAILFFLAGYETTNTALSYISYVLATNPECQERLIKEIDDKLAGKAPDYDSVSKLQYLENVYLETLRMFPGAVRTSRIANEDIEMNGILIKKDVEVHIPIISIHFDPEIWPDPDTFNPDRFLPENRPSNYGYVYLPFGAGPRNCIGMRLAQMEVKMAIAAVLQKYKFKTAPETKIPPDVDAQMRPKDGMVLMIEKR